MRWERVEDLAGCASTLADLHFHGLELVAARRLRMRGEAVAPQLLAGERLSAVLAMAAPVMLRHVRAAYGGRLALIKGPEIAARYPDPALRMYRDIDLLADDACAAHRALLDAGFAPTGMWAPHAERHHLRPLRWPDLPIIVEVHSEPHFPPGLRPPPTADLLAGTVPARSGDGIVDALAPAAHTLVVAAHAWAHGPLASIGQLVDVALLADEVDPAELEALARRWGCGRLWRTTSTTIKALFGEAGPTPAHMRVLAPHLRAARARTLLERHVEELASPLFGLPAAGAVSQTAQVLMRRVRPAAEETWPAKLRRARRALRHARLRHSEHDARLPPEDRHIGGIPGLEPAPEAEPRAAR